MLPFSLFAVVIVVALVLLFLQRQESLERAWPAPEAMLMDWDRNRAVCDFG